MSRVVRRLAATAAALTVLVGCGAAGPTEGSTAPADHTPLTELTHLENPREHVGPSTAVLASREVETVAGVQEPQLPTTVTSHDRSGERQITVTDASRVLALDMSGSIAATIQGLGLGDTLVGRDQSTTFPGTEDLPVVTGDGHSISAEAVIAVEPTLVITDGSIGPRDVVEQLRDVGITVVFVENESSFEGAAALAEQVAAVYGVDEAGVELAQRIRDEVETTTREIKQLLPAPKDRLRMIFLYIRGGSGIYYLFGEESGADEIIEALGGIDIAGEQGWDGMKPMTDEAIAAADPDLVLVMTHGIDSAGGVDGLLAEKPALALTQAGENRRFVDMADGDVLSFGPRSAEILEALARAVYAPGPSS